MAVMMLTSATALAGAKCSESFYRDIYNRSIKLDRSSSACNRALRSRTISIAKVCSACKPTILAMSVIESKVRNNRSCFSSTRDGRKILADLAQVREAVRFMRRGCGY